MASKYDLMHYGIMIVACMSVQEMFDDTQIKTTMRENSKVYDNSEEEQESESDKDLETQIDRDQKRARQQKQISLKKQLKKDTTNAIK